MIRVAKAELLHALRGERDGALLRLSGLREPMKRRFHKRPMDPLAWVALQNETERVRESRKRKRK